jgi:sugar lactone lactonase YvrE
MRRDWILILAILFLAGCTTGGPLAVSPSPSASLPAPAVTSLPLPTITALPPTAAPSPLPPAAVPTQARLNLTDPTVEVLASGLPQPDDLLLGPDGSVHISTLGDGAVRHYDPQGNMQVLIKGLATPEGMLFLPDGSLLIVEQGRNRLLRLDLQTKTLTPFLNLTNHTNNEGVDNIAMDARDPSNPGLIIPDSPNGALLRANLDGSGVTEIARGMVRPTAAWVEPDGSILVADEFGNALLRIHPDGSMDKLASLPQPDDVIEDSAGNIYICTLVDGAVYVLPAGSGQARVLASGFIQPQGLIFAADGNLLVTDSGHGRLVKILIR